MHGKRKRDVKPLTPEERIKNEEQGEKIINLINDFLDIRHGQKQANNPAEYCDIIANMCPDLPTIYNYKREVVQKAFEQTKNPKDQYKILMNELQLVTGLLKRSPKSYSLWSYRQWLVLECRALERLYHKLKAAAQEKALIEKQKKEKEQTENQTEQDNNSEKEKENEQKEQQQAEEQIPQVVELELKLCNKMLDMDERNFHCWNYRNWLINDVENNSLSYVEREIKYTQTKYENNFSNFSALHFRSKNLVKKYDQELSTIYNQQQQSNIEETKKELQQRITELIQFKIPLQSIKDELELIKNAIFIQPNEQGVWLYHKWIVSLLVPYRFISAKYKNNNDKSIVTLTSSSKINSSNLNKTIELFDQNNNKLDYIIQQDGIINQIGQSFTLKSTENQIIHRIVINQNNSINHQIVDQQMDKRNLISSEFIFNNDNSNSQSQHFILQKINEQDQQFQNNAYEILEEEQQFVEEIIENENTSKFAHFHKLYLVQVKQSLDLIFKTNENQLHIDSSNNILKIIDQLNTLAKKQTFYLKNLSSQYHDLLRLQENLLQQEQQSENNQIQSVELPASPTYEIDLLIPYYSLQNNSK